MGKCTCFEDALQKVKQHVAAKLPTGATEFEVEWENMAFILAAGDYPSVNPRVAYSYRQQKRDGTPAKNLTKGTLSMFCSYCPFCGRKYEKDGKEAA